MGEKQKFGFLMFTDRAIVYCTVCDAQIRIRPNEQEAIEAWNKRVSEVAE